MKSQPPVSKNAMVSALSFTFLSCQMLPAVLAVSGTQKSWGRGQQFSPRTTSFIPKSDLPPEMRTNTDWVSFHESVEFLPANDQSLNMDMARRLASSSSGSGTFPYDVQPFIDGDAEYDEYQQAWRYLGFMIDCNESYGADDDGSGSGSGDSLTGEGCHRYVIWAAYVDLDYQGGGIGEYQYWDRQNKRWNDTPCLYAKAGGSGSGSGDNENEGSRCAKMDCHLEDTHWSLLGFFKHKSYDDWMEQLFKHEGYCIWTEEEYKFMSNARKSWPKGCAISGSYFPNGDPVYYDVKPVVDGSITLALYEDTQCVVEYKSQGSSDSINIENVLGNILMGKGGSHSGSGDDDMYNPDDYTLTEALALWESAFDIFKICQPCVAHDLNNYGYGTDDDASKGSAYGFYTYGNNYDDDYSKSYYADQGANFDCYDQADYTNVNQCMKFMAKTTMQTATFRDIALATTQGTLVDSQPYVSGSRVTSYSSKHSAVGTFFLFLFSMSILFLGIRAFRRAKRSTNSESKYNLKKRLTIA